MHHSRLISSLCLSLALVACRKDEAPAVSSKTAPAKLEAVSAPPLNAIVYAASTHLRIVDLAKAAVVGGIDLSRAVNAMAFAPNAARLYLATSGGVFEVDTKSRALGPRLTTSPARDVLIGGGGAKVHVLEHDVIVGADGTREVLPFRLKTIDAASGRVLGEEEIGQRILYVLPSENGRHHLVITEAGEVFLGAAGTPLSEGRRLDLGAGATNAGPMRVRPYVALFEDHAYVPVEGESGRVLDVNLRNGETSRIELGSMVMIRGMTLSPSGGRLVVNAMRELIVIDRPGRVVSSRFELENVHQGIALSSDGRFAFLAQTIDETGGAVGVFDLEALAFLTKIHLDDISPWAIAAAP